MEINFYSKEQTDSKLDDKANSSDVYKKNETLNIQEINDIIDSKIAEIDIPDVSDFYTKSETYTKIEVNNLVSPKANSTDVYTKTQVDNLIASQPVYNGIIRIDITPTVQYNGLNHVKVIFPNDFSFDNNDILIIAYEINSSNFIGGTRSLIMTGLNAYNIRKYQNEEDFDNKKKSRQITYTNSNKTLTINSYVDGVLDNPSSAFVRLCYVLRKI